MGKKKFSVRRIYKASVVIHSKFTKTKLRI